MNNSSNQNRKIIDKVVIHTIFNPNDGTDIKVRNKQNIEYIKEQAKNIIDDTAQITECPPDGTIVISHHYRENLPNEILDLIIFYFRNERQSKQDQQSLQNDLYQCSLVNKQFYQQINPLLWHTPVISNTDTLDRFLTCLTDTPPDSLALKRNKLHHTTVTHNVLPAKHHIRRLDMQGHCGWDDIKLSFMLPSLVFLETLTFDYYTTSEVTDASLQYFPRYCPNITTLGFVPTSSFILPMILQSHQLTQIELYLTSKNLDGDIFKCLWMCPSLNTLVLITDNRDIYGKSFLTRSMVMDIMALNRLKCLSFIGWGLSSTLTRVFNILTHGNNNTNPWPLLSSLRLDCGGFDLRDGIMIPFIESHPHLQNLHIDTTNLSDATLEKIGTHLPGLTHLRLGGNNSISTNGVYNLVRRCHDLKHADFPSCCRLKYCMINYPTLTIADMDKIRERGDND